MLLDIARTPGKELFPPSYVISGNESKGFESTLIAWLLLSMTNLCRLHHLIFQPGDNEMAALVNVVLHRLTGRVRIAAL
jgi:hypothetical protein